MEKNNQEFIELCNKLSDEYGHLIQCSILYDRATQTYSPQNKCRYGLKNFEFNREKCDKCFLFHSREAELYQKVLKRYNQKEIKEDET